jgi:hypothetical protein
MRRTEWYEDPRRILRGEVLQAAASIREFFPSGGTSYTQKRRGGSHSMPQDPALVDSGPPFATDVFSEIMSTPDKGIPQDLLENSHWIVIVPGLKKGAFIVGGKFGRGFLSCRASNGHGWSAPGAVRPVR